VRSQSTNPYRRFAWCDAVFALAVALSAVVYGNSARLPPGGVRQFLQVRVTVLNALFAGIFMIAWISVFAALDVHCPQSSGIFRKFIRIIEGCAAMTLLLVGYLYCAHTTGPTGRIGVVFFVGSFCYKAFRILGNKWIAARDPQLVVILGSGRRAVKAWRQIRTQYHGPVKLVGFVDDRSVSEMAPDVAARYLGAIDDLSSLLLRNVVDELLIAMPVKSCYDSIQRAVAIAEEVGVQIAYMQDMYATTIKHTAAGDDELFSDLVPLHEHYVTRQGIKRLVDVVGAAAGICLLSPLLLLIAFAVKLSSKGPVFFVQHRYGYRRRLFRMYKFRSMIRNAPELMAQMESRNEAVGPIFKMRLDPRATPVGRFLRTTSLDELPQLWNVLIGNMSLVGPRPMSVRDVSLFDEAALMRRFTVKPGITGLWQISGRSAVSFDQWIKLDFSYIDEWSLALDFQILARTIGAVVKRTGAV
jgi:exopolysaccharide biosynthesis polyprenyl glycosylphosphotransferase